MAKVMNIEQNDLFQRYTALGPDRTLAALYESIRADDRYKHITKRQLDRWSAQWQWANMAKQVNDVAVKAASDAIAPVIASMVTEQIEALHTVQRRFIERLAIDPSNPNLSEAQRARAIDPDFRDFQDAVRTEKLILGDPNAEKPHEVKDSALAKQLGLGDVRRITIELAQKQFGAATVVPDPLPDDVIDVEVKQLSGD